MRFSGKLTPLRISLIYVLVALLWILFSDRLVGFSVTDSQAITELQTYKGIFYVLATALLLFVLIRRQMRTLQASEDRLKSLLQSLPEAVLVIDQHGRITKSNRAALALFGKDDGSLQVEFSRLMRDARLRCADGRPVDTHADPLSRALKGEVIYNWDGVIHAEDSEEIPVSVSASPVREAAGGPVTRAILVFRNTGELKRLERMRDEFLSTAAHELKTPMTTIKAYVQLLRKWNPPQLGEREQKALTVLGHQCDRMNKLIQDLLEFSRLQLGRLQLNKVRIELRALTAEVLSHMQGITLRHELSLSAGPEQWVNADPDRIEQILINLVDNAIKFSPEGGPIEVAIRDEEGETRISVRDHGLGIRPENQLRLFSRHYRAHAGTGYDHSSGMGMGLFICRELVSRHGGRIWCQSKEMEGSVFHFTLPSAETPSTTSPGPPGERPRHAIA